MGVLNITNDFTSGSVISSSQVNANHSSIETWSTTISDDNFSAAAGMYTAYRTIHETNGQAYNGLGGGTYSFQVTGGAVASGSALAVQHVTKHLAAADFAIAGRTTKLRVRASVACNATAPAVNFTFGLASMTAIGGGANTISYSLTGVGANAVINAPPASAATSAVSADLNVPADGLYLLFMSTSAALAAGNFCGLRLELQQRWV